MGLPETEAKYLSSTEHLATYAQPYGEAAARQSSEFLREGVVREGERLPSFEAVQGRRRGASVGAVSARSREVLDGPAEGGLGEFERGSGGREDAEQEVPERTPTPTTNSNTTTDDVTTAPAAEDAPLGS